MEKKESFHPCNTIRCKVSLNSLALSYQILHQSLVLGYDYRRWKLHIGGWILPDSKVNCHEFKVDITCSIFQEPRNLIVNMNWKLKDISESLEFLDFLNSSYRFKINGTTIRKRVEQLTSCTSCMPPNIVCLSHSHWEEI